MGIITVTIETNHVDFYEGIDAEGNTLWTVESAESLNPDDDSDQWLFNVEGTDITRWFDDEGSAVAHAEEQLYNVPEER